MELTDLQLRLLSLLAKEDGATTTKLVEALGIPEAEFDATAEPLLVDDLVGTAVPTLGTGWWWITSKGREALRS
jgi:hypothetical protein